MTNFSIKKYRLYAGCETFLRLIYVNKLSKTRDILTKQMLEDKDSFCRAWSASSLMQMSFHGVDKELLQEKTKSCFASGIAAETDLYACGIMIEAAQVLFGKKWISSSAVEDVDIEKIEKARKSAVRFLNK